MKKILLTWIFLGMLAATLDAATPASWDKVISVKVHAPDHKFNGKPWDMNPMIILPIFLSPMDSVGNPNPDMMLCIVDSDGQSECIYDRKNPPNHFGVPYSICRDSLICEFTNVKVPSAGYFGMLVVDLDWIPRTNAGLLAKVSGHDYMIGAEIRNSGQPEDPKARFRVEEALRALIKRWGVVDAPDEFPDASIRDCTYSDPCFGSEPRGVPSVGINAQKVEVCGMDISGTLSFSPASDRNTVDLRFNEEENKCKGLGTMEYLWQFGDGTTGTSTEPAVEHIYPGIGKYGASVTPRCVRKQSVCDAPSAPSPVTVAR